MNPFHCWLNVKDQLPTIFPNSLEDIGSKIDLNCEVLVAFKGVAFAAVLSKHNGELVWRLSERAILPFDKIEWWAWMPIAPGAFSSIIKPVGVTI